MLKLHEKMAQKKSLTKEELILLEEMGDVFISAARFGFNCALRGWTFEKTKKELKESMININNKIMGKSK